MRVKSATYENQYNAKAYGGILECRHLSRYIFINYGWGVLLAFVTAKWAHGQRHRNKQREAESNPQTGFC